MKNKSYKEINNYNTILKGMSLFDLEKWCEYHDIEKFRAKQLYKWIYNKQENNPLKFLNIPIDFRKKILKNCIFNLLIKENEYKSNYEKTTKFLFRLLDNNYIESVSMIDNQYHTVCLSSQVGCNLDCKFCSTGTMGFIRNLSSGEIVEQLEYIKRKTSQPITNIVFMGMGEPFLNYNNVLKAADIFHHPLGYGFSNNRITISTAGVVPKIEKFIKEKRKFKLAVSLNAVTDEVRNTIMPINKTWSITNLIKSSKLFVNQKRKNIMFEYVLLKDINDSLDDANQLMKMIKGINCKLNIIPYNETDGNYQRPNDKTINLFIKALLVNQKKYGYRVLVRWSKGQDISAGCGQLAISK